MRIQNFSKFVKYYGKRRKIKLLGFFLLSLIIGFFEFLGIALVYPFILLIIKPENVIHTKYYIEFASFFHQDNFLINAFIIGTLVGLVFIFKNIFMMLAIYLQTKFVNNWKLAINKRFMKYYLFSSYKTSLKTSASEKFYKLNFLIGQSLDGFIFRIINLVTNTVIVAMILTLLFMKFPFAAIATTIFISICMLIHRKVFKSKTEEISRNFSKMALSSNDKTMEIINNLKELKILSAEDFFLAQFNKTQEEYNKILLKNTFYCAIPPYIIEIFVVLALLILAGIISIQNIENTSWMIASYAVVVAAIFRIAPALNRIQTSLNAINSSREVVKIMISEYEDSNLNETEERANSKIDFKDSISLKNIEFAYSKTPIIKDLNLEIKKGEFVGIIGLSGAGKSTLADIIMGLLPIDKGEIFIDDIQLNSSNFGVLRKLIGYVPQQINILDGSFKRNVAWGIDEKDINEYKVIDVLKKAQIYDFICGFKDGINSKAIIGSNGLSQGQKQRLALARALYRNPDILILDEATSSLDVETEHEITKMLNELKGEKTIIAIAHRLSTLKNCDRLIYLKSGKIVDTGSFEELSRKHADFEKLIKLSRIENG